MPAAAAAAHCNHCSPQGSAGTLNLEQKTRKLLQSRPTGTCISNSVSPTKAQLASKSDAVNFQTIMLASSPSRCTGGTLAITFNCPACQQERPVATQAGPSQRAPQAIHAAHHRDILTPIAFHTTHLLPQGFQQAFASMHVHALARQSANTAGTFTH